MSDKKIQGKLEGGVFVRGVNGSWVKKIHNTETQPSPSYKPERFEVPESTATQIIPTRTGLNPASWAAHS